MKRPLAAAVALLGFVAGVFPIFQSDLFWHLASGRWILERLAMPRVDPFRFTSGGASWVDHEWLFQVLVRGAERLGGLDALVLLRAGALALFALVLHLAARRSGLGAGLAALVAIGSTLGVRPRFLVRPEIFTLFAIVALLALLERATASSGPATRRFAPAVALTLVWVQLHGEALLGPGLAFLFLLGAARERRLGWRTVFGVPALLGVALLANPYGWRLVEVPFGIAGALRDLSAQNPEWMSAFEAPQPYLFGGMAVVATLAIAARLETGRWPAPERGLPTAALALVALTGVRHQALFYAAAAPFAASCLACLRAVRELDPRTERRLALAALALAGLAAAWCVAPPESGLLRARHGGLAWGFGLAPGRFPERAAGEIERHPDLGPLYNELVHGGYLLWRLYPPRRVFVDGRMELEPGLLRELASARGDAGRWRELLVGRGAVGALVRYESRRLQVVEPDGAGGLRAVGSGTANSLLFPRALWDLAYWDDETMLFLLPGSPGWEEPPYRAIDPEDLEGTLRLAGSDADYRRAALAEIERKLSEQPDCRRAMALRDALAATGGI
ncbi:MAG: hypothetical protein H6511_00730 [Holophagales bacterium]|nr:hypothetical protein [Holophagales bacterium]